MVFITNPFWERGEIDMALRELKVCLLGVSHHRLLSERILYVRSVWSPHCQMIPVASNEPYTSSIRLSILTTGRSVHISQTRLYPKSCYCVAHTGEFLMLPRHIMSVRVLCFFTGNTSIASLFQLVNGWYEVLDTVLPFLTKFLYF